MIVQERFIGVIESWFSNGLIIGIGFINGLVDFLGVSSGITIKQLLGIYLLFNTHNNTNIEVVVSTTSMPVL